ncbi:hypothetical protein H6P81_011135 [Aristolochia fimbriata]|uniref:Uncharacterized protein n=1 Tax=Aristolochia fimbriata TaxID=158543 RepID=A0AAV7EQP6_ARIFI|nr:hypothetical protein H6P81_011135 [Aristolochia fimbriata]
MMCCSLRRCGLFFRNWNRDVVGFRLFLPFSTVAAEDHPSSNTFVIDYLMKRCGFTTEKAKKASSFFPRIDSSEKPDSVLEFLKERGFSKTHIRIILSRQPRLLLCKIDKTLKPKFEFFEELGVSRHDIVRLFTKDSVVLARSLDDHLIPCVDFLRTQFGSDLDLPKVLKKSWKLLSFNLRKTILPHIEALRSRGLDDKQIQKLFLSHPSMFARKVTVLEDVISRIEKINAKFRPGMLIYAVYVVDKISVAKVEDKWKVFNSLGWSDEDIVSAFEKFPYLLATSEEKIRALIEFVNQLGYDPKEIPATAFGMSMEKRIRPRYEILRILQKAGVLKEKISLYAIISMKESAFFERYVAPYVDDIPQLQMYTSQLQSSKMSK